LTIIRPSTENPTWSPNKLFDSLAAGKPVVANVRGWIAEMIRDNHCGRTTEPENPRDLAEVLMELSSDAELCDDYSKNARRLAETAYSREQLASKLESALVAVCTMDKPFAGSGHFLGTSRGCSQSANHLRHSS
jgi:glycosyltransferase involved in cell wall biosynthesis